MNWNKTMRECAYVYNAHGKRSNKKLYSLHRDLGQEILTYGENLSCYGLGFQDTDEKITKITKRTPTTIYDGKEYPAKYFIELDICGVQTIYWRGREITVEGKLHRKKTDLVIKQNTIQKAILFTKVAMSNFHQNAINAADAVPGETFNLRLAGHVVGQVVILQTQYPYFDEDGNITKTEQLSKHHLDPYIELSKVSLDQMARPNALLLIVLDEQNGEYTQISLDKFYDKIDTNMVKLGCFHAFIRDLGLYNTNQSIEVEQWLQSIKRK